MTPAPVGLRPALIAASVAASAAAVPLSAAAVAGRTVEQHATLRNSVAQSARADATNTGSAVHGSISTGDAASAARPVQRLLNRQTIAAGRECARRRCSQAAELTNAGALTSRAYTANSGDASAGASISTGDASSSVRLDQHAANRQAIEPAQPCAPAPCEEAAIVRNRATLKAVADARNARKAAGGRTVATDDARSRVHVQQRAASRQIVAGEPRCPGAGCARPARVRNDAVVVSRAGPGAHMGGTRVRTSDGKDGNSARIHQTGRANSVALQQLRQRIEQTGTDNFVRNTMRQLIVVRGGHATVAHVESWSTTRRTGAPRPDLRGLPPPAGGAVCPPATLRTRCRAPAPGGSELRIAQTGAENVAAAQQAGQFVRQVGRRNHAVNELEQVVVVRAPRPEAIAAAPPGGVARREVASSCGSRRCARLLHAERTVVMQCSRALRGLAAVQQARQSIRQVGRFNYARNTSRILVRFRPVGAPRAAAAAGPIRSPRRGACRVAGA